jgi:hypothetical protein
MYRRAAHFKTFSWSGGEAAAPRVRPAPSGMIPKVTNLQIEINNLRAMATMAIRRVRP